MPVINVPGGHIHPLRPPIPPFVLAQLLGTGIALWDNALGSALTANLHDEVVALHDDDLFVPATVGRARHPRADIRSDEILWMLPRSGTQPDYVTPNPGLTGLRLLLDELGRELSRLAFVRLDETEMMASHYPPGGFYTRHVDTFADQGDRVFTYVLFLNPTWVDGDGGVLQLHGEAPRLIDPIYGRLAVFHTPNRLHEVTETRNARFAVTGWLKPNANTASL